MTFKKITEQESHYNHLEKKSVEELLRDINKEDQTVAAAVEKAIPQIESLVHVIVERMSSGGKLFY
ncbi:MAG: N-acetylmuramic acid 6-phosphate etherase, partial [Nonlabens sp.]